MKKLMIAAAAAAMVSGAFASLCDDEPIVQAGCAVYDVKFTFNSLDTKLLATKGTKNVCGDADVGSCCVYLENGKYTFNGIIWDCYAACEMMLGDVANKPAPNFILWSTKAKMPLTQPLSYDASNKVWQADTALFTVSERYSKKANKVHAFWGGDDETNLTGQPIVTAWDDDTWASDAASGVIYAAGFGTFDTKNDRVTAISGNAVALFGVPAIPGYFDANGGDRAAWTAMQTIITKQKCDNPVPYVMLCGDFESWCADGQDATYLSASGSWSVKYNKSLSTGSKRLSQIVPSYAQAK